jgi:hypothetical protein
VLSADGIRVGAFTDAPEPLARIALAQLGATRHVEAMEAGAGALDRLRARLGGDVRVVETPTELYARDRTPKPD